MSLNRHCAIQVTRPGQNHIVRMSRRCGSVLMLALSLSLMTWLTVLAAETVESGNLNGKALSLPVPLYPAIAKQSRITGMVKVDVIINESGKVESAKATVGNTVLRQAAVDAALRAKFAPTLKAGAPVKVTGFLQYEFKLD
jgi:TonB family protein